jgi:pseudouridine synthase
MERRPSPTRTVTAPSRSKPTADGGERLQKILSAAGVASRRAAEGLIEAGRVTVNGRIVRELGSRADPRKDRIAVDGVRLDVGGRRRTFALHKPRGVVSTMSDPEGRPTIRHLMGSGGERLYPIGRLDLQTTGLLLVTNDGTLASALLAPEREVERVYRVKIDGRPGPTALERLRRGIRLAPGPPVVAGVRVLRELPTKTWLEIRVRRGPWHVVRRLCEAIGHPVDKLARVALGPIGLGSLPLGAMRELSASELASLRAAAGLTPSRSDAGAAPAAARAPVHSPRTPPRRGGPRRGARGRNARRG